MKNKICKIIATATACVLLLSMLPLSMMAASAETEPVLPDVGETTTCSAVQIVSQSYVAAYAEPNGFASVEVDAVGDGLTYTWYVKDPVDFNYYKSSITEKVYSAKMTETASGRLAYCIVEDEYGNYARSKTFVLRRKAVITQESSTASYADYNKYASASVTAVGDNVTYTWYVKDVGDSRYYKSSIATNTYKAKMTSATSGRLAYCIVKDQYGHSVRSKTFVLRMKATITGVPDTEAFAKQNAKVSVKIGAAGDNLTYTWYIKNANQTKYTKSSIKSATYTTEMNASSKNRRVYCVIKDKYGKSVQTKTFILREAVSIVTQPKTTVTAKGATAKVTVKASGDGLRYEWFIKNAGQTKYTRSSVTGSTYAAKMNATTKGRLVLCKVSDKYGNTVQTQTVQLKMK